MLRSLLIKICHGEERFKIPLSGMKNADLWIECEYVGVASSCCPAAVALLTKTRKRNVKSISSVREGALWRFAIIVPQNGTIKVVSRPGNNPGGAKQNFLHHIWFIRWTKKIKFPTLVRPGYDFDWCYSTSQWLETSCSAFCSTRDTVCSSSEKFNFAKWQKVWKHEMHLMGRPLISHPAW